MGAYSIYIYIYNVFSQCDVHTIFLCLVLSFSYFPSLAWSFCFLWLLSGYVMFSTDIYKKSVFHIFAFICFRYSIFMELFMNSFLEFISPMWREFRMGELLSKAGGLIKGLGGLEGS